MDKQKIKAAKDGLRAGITEIHAAEAMLAELHEKLSPAVAVLIKESGQNGPHKIRLNADDPDSAILVTFRKTGEHLSGGKAHPTYGMTIVNLSGDPE